MPVDKVIETDILVVGGGMAGFFAAIKSRERGLKVTLVDKGYAGRSGQTPFASCFAVLNEEWGDNCSDWVMEVSRCGEYINNRDWTEIMFRESYARYQDLVSWGVQFRHDEDWPPGEVPHHKLVFLKAKVFCDILRNRALKQGVVIIDRCMVTDLIKQEGRIVGALGMPMERHDIYIFKSKATVLCSGAGGFKPWGWPISALTSDGDAMAYRVGGEITGKEFSDNHTTSSDSPAHFNFSQWMQGAQKGKLVNTEGKEIPPGHAFLYTEFEVHAGRAPICWETPDGKKSQLVGGASSGMSVPKTEGLWPIDTYCSSSIPGLYAAGDALGNMALGATYAHLGCALMGSSVTGTIAGIASSKFAKSVKLPEMDYGKINQLKDNIKYPLNRKGGFSPRWVIQLLQNTMIPYFVLFIKKEDRLKAALTNVEFFRDHLIPRLFARDPHELRLAIETKNMVLNAEMRLRASLARVESRGCHYREDYPRRDDDNWLAWVLLKEENGLMKALKTFVPKKWRPDLNIPYDERYPDAVRFPGEQDL